MEWAELSRVAASPRPRIWLCFSMDCFWIQHCPHDMLMLAWSQMIRMAHLLRGGSLQAPRAWCNLVMTTTTLMMTAMTALMQ